MPSARFLPLFLGDRITVTISSPTPGETITNAAPTVIWSFSPGTQQSFRVRVFGDIARVETAYDSGTVVSSVTQHTIPEGFLLSGETYYLFVEIETTTADLGESELVSFSTSFVPTVAVVGVSAETLNDNCEPGRGTGNPHVLVRWAEVVPDVTETFQRYSIWRRARLAPGHPDAGTEQWIRVGSVATVSTLEFRDYCAAAYTVYEYAVTWTALTTLGDTRVANRQTPPPNIRLRFDHVYLHDTEDPSLFARWAPDTASVEGNQSLALRSVWGRSAPTAVLSEFDSSIIRVSGTPELHRDGLWTKTRGMQRRQALGSTVCIRLGYSAERFFGIIVSPLTRNDGLFQYTAAVELAETHFEEAVA